MSWDRGAVRQTLLLSLTLLQLRGLLRGVGSLPIEVMSAFLSTGAFSLGESEALGRAPQDLALSLLLLLLVPGYWPAFPLEASLAQELLHHGHTEEGRHSVHCAWLSGSFLF